MRKAIKPILILLAFLALFASCKVKGIRLTPEVVELGLGEEAQFTVVTVPDNVRKNVNSFSSSDISIASVDATGLVVGEGVGEATISVTASKSKGEQKAEALVKVVGVIKVSADDTYLTAAGKSISYRYFESEEEFLEKVYFYNKLALTGLAVEDFTIEDIKCEPNSLISLSGLFTKGGKLPKDFFGKMKTYNGQRGETYSTKFSMELSANGIVIPIQWDDSKGDKEFTIPDAGNFVLTSDNFELSNINENDLTLKVTLVNFKKLVKGAYDDDSESGDGTVWISVNNDGAQIASEQSFQISDSISIDLSGFTKRENALTFDIRFLLNSGATPVMANNVVVNFIFPEKKVVIEKNMTITPLHVSIARSSNERGVIEERGTVLLNYGGEIEYGLRQLLGSDYRQFNYDKATWSGDIVNAANGSTVAKIENAAFKKRAYFDLSLASPIEVQLKNAAISVPHSQQASTTLLVRLQWEGDAVWGDKISIKNSVDFPQSIKINDGIVSNSGTTYALVFGDDFNYHFNGLNYKNVSLYHALKAKPNVDYEAYRYNMYWDAESDYPYARKGSSGGSWDIRNAEVKNGRLLSKVLAQDPSAGTVYMGPSQTKGLPGFSDLVPGVNVLTGCTRSKTVRFGYVEGKVRVKNKAYNSSVPSGPWYAFWLHGDMHEYDIMEFCNNGKTSNMVIHWHNGWGNYGGNAGGSSWINYNCPEDWNNEWWTLGIYWDDSKVIWSYNGREMARMTATNNNTGVQFSFPNGTNAWGKQNTGKRTINDGTTYNKDLNPEIAGGTTPIPYGSNKLKGVMDVPMNIFASTEQENAGWGGTFAGVDKLPTWLEVDYIAYYLPEQSISSVKLSTPTSTILSVGDTLTLNYTISPAQTTQRDVTWSSTKPEVATVSGGTVTAIGAGSTVIKVASVSNPSIYDEVTITVVNDMVDITKVEVTPASATLALGQSLKLTATVLPSSATIKDVEWNSTDYNIVSVDGNGNLTSIGSGTATITATSIANPEIFGSATITVVVLPTGISLNRSNISVGVGKEEVIAANVEPVGAAQDVIWESSNNNVATVSGGIVRGVSNGVAIITAKVKENPSLTASCNVTVESAEAAPVTIVVDGITANLVKGFDFTNNTDISLYSTMTISDGTLKVNGDLGNNCLITFNNIGDVDAMAIRYKYSGCSPNLNVEFGTDSNHYTFYRPGASVSVFSGDWHTRYFDQGSFDANPNEWISQKVLGNSGVIRMTFGDQLKKGNFTKNGNWSNSAQICFRDTNSGTAGTFEVEYVGFYKIPNEAPQTIIRNGKLYQLVQAFNFDNNMDLGFSNTSIVSSINGNEECVIAFPNAKPEGSAAITFGPFEENASYIEIRAKISNTSFMPHIGVESWQNALIRNTFNGIAGEGFAFRVNGATPNDENQKTPFVANEYTLLGYIFSGNSTHSYFQDGEFKINLTSSSYNAPAPNNTFSFYIGQDGNGSGTVTLDYVAFYK